jgi:hypothetical protein
MSASVSAAYTQLAQPLRSVVRELVFQSLSAGAEICTLAIQTITDPALPPSVKPADLVKTLILAAIEFKHRSVESVLSYLGAGTAAERLSTGESFGRGGVERAQSLLAKAAQLERDGTVENVLRIKHAVRLLDESVYSLPDHMLKLGKVNQENTRQRLPSPPSHVKIEFGTKPEKKSNNTSQSPKPSQPKTSPEGANKIKDKYGEPREWTPDKYPKELFGQAPSDDREESVPQLATQSEFIPAGPASKHPVPKLPIHRLQKDSILNQDKMPILTITNFSGIKWIPRKRFESPQQNVKNQISMDSNSRRSQSPSTRLSRERDFHKYKNIKQGNSHTGGLAVLPEASDTEGDWSDMLPANRTSPLNQTLQSPLLPPSLIDTNYKQHSLPKLSISLSAGLQLLPKTTKKPATLLTISSLAKLLSIPPKVPPKLAKATSVFNYSIAGQKKAAAVVSQPQVVLSLQKIYPLQKLPTASPPKLISLAKWQGVLINGSTIARSKVMEASSRITPPVYLSFASYQGIRLDSRKSFVVPPRILPCVNTIGINLPGKMLPRIVSWTLSSVLIQSKQKPPVVVSRDAILMASKLQSILIQGKQPLLTINHSTNVPTQAILSTTPIRPLLYIPRDRPMVISAQTTSTLMQPSKPFIFMSPLSPICIPPSRIVAPPLARVPLLAIRIPTLSIPGIPKQQVTVPKMLLSMTSIQSLGLQSKSNQPPRLLSYSVPSLTIPSATKPLLTISKISSLNRNPRIAAFSSSLPLTSSLVMHYLHAPRSSLSPSNRLQKSILPSTLNIPPKQRATLLLMKLQPLQVYSTPKIVTNRTCSVQTFPALATRYSIKKESSAAVVQLSVEKTSPISIKSYLPTLFTHKINNITLVKNLPLLSKTPLPPITLAGKNPNLTLHKTTPLSLPSKTPLLHLVKIPTLSLTKAKSQLSFKELATVAIKGKEKVVTLAEGGKGAVAGLVVCLVGKVEVLGRKAELGVQSTESRFIRGREVQLSGFVCKDILIRGVEARKKIKEGQVDEMKESPVVIEYYKMRSVTVEGKMTIMQSHKLPTFNIERKLPVLHSNTIQPITIQNVPKPILTSRSLLPVTIRGSVQPMLSLIKIPSVGVKGAVRASLASATLKSVQITGILRPLPPLPKLTTTNLYPISRPSLTQPKPTISSSVLSQLSIKGTPSPQPNLSKTPLQSLYIAPSPQKSPAQPSQQPVAPKTSRHIPLSGPGIPAPVVVESGPVLTTTSLHTRSFLPKPTVLVVEKVGSRVVEPKVKARILKICQLWPFIYVPHKRASSSIDKVQSPLKQTANPNQLATQAHLSYKALEVVPLQSKSITPKPLELKVAITQQTKIIPEERRTSLALATLQERSISPKPIDLKITSIAQTNLTPQHPRASFTMTPLQPNSIAPTSSQPQQTAQPIINIQNPSSSPTQVNLSRVNQTSGTSIGLGKVDGKGVGDGGKVESNGGKDGDAVKVAGKTGVEARPSVVSLQGSLPKIEPTIITKTEVDAVPKRTSVSDLIAKRNSGIQSTPKESNITEPLLKPITTSETMQKRVSVFDSVAKFNAGANSASNHVTPTQSPPKSPSPLPKARLSIALPINTHVIPPITINVEAHHFKLPPKLPKTPSLSFQSDYLTPRSKNDDPLLDDHLLNEDPILPLDSHSDRNNNTAKLSQSFRSIAQSERKPPSQHLEDSYISKKDEKVPNDKKDEINPPPENYSFNSDKMFDSLNKSEQKSMDYLNESNHYSSIGDLKQSNQDSIKPSIQQSNPRSSLTNDKNPDVLAKKKEERYKKTVDPILTKMLNMTNAQLAIKEGRSKVPLLEDQGRLFKPTKFSIGNLTEAQSLFGEFSITTLELHESKLMFYHRCN